jgi:SP family general alpha glucoside:H+ symporter-like MFS transporter
MESGKLETGNIKSKEEVGQHVDTLYPEVLVNQDLFGDAVDGENREHDMSMWAAAKSHPKACIWAFIMCFTIVSLP